MKKTLALAAMFGLFATPVQAEHWDIIGSKLKDGCTMGTYMAIVKDFNEWGKSHGYKATILTPIQDRDLETFWWIGKTKDAAAFGAAWDAWRNALSDPNSTEAKLQARFDKCSTDTSRSGYDAW